MNPLKNGRITTPFDEMRPVSNPTHVHGALDIAPRHDRTIYAPCNGVAFGYMARRVPEDSKPQAGDSRNRYWPKMPEINGRPFPFCNYFYDMYGCIIVFQETDHNENIVNTHLICHSFGNQVFNKSPLHNAEKYYVEEQAKSRYPLGAWYTGVLAFREGEPIGYVGDAGFSTGPHIHWEIHPGTMWCKHADRIHPQKYM